MSQLSYFKIMNAANDERATLYIYDYVGKWGDEGIDDKDFVAMLNEAGGKPLDVRINSGGGSVYDGVAIYNAIKQYPNDVVIYIDGLAASIASVIACASDDVRIGNGASFMVHGVSGGLFAYGSEEDIKDAADRYLAALKNCKENILDIYENKTGKPRAELSKLMETDTYFTAQEAVDFGFCNEVIKDKPDKTLQNSLQSIMQRTPHQEVTAVYNRLFNAINKPIVNKEEIKMPQNEINIKEIEAKAIAKYEAERQEKEASRQTGIRAVFDGHKQEVLMNECLLNLNCTVDEAKNKLLDSLKNAQPAATSEPLGGIQITKDSFDNQITGIKNSWGARAENKYDEGSEFKNCSINTAINIILAKNGIRPGNSRAESVELLIKNRVLTMDDFTVLMGDFVYRSLLGGYSLAGTSWQKFCSIGSFEDFREQELHSVGVMGDLEEKGADGNYVEGILPDTEVQRYKPKEMGRLITIERKTLINDDLGVIRDMASDAGGATARTIDNAVWNYIISNPILRDGKPLFHADHGNLLDDGVMSIESWKKMAELFYLQKAVNSDAYLNLSPEIILTTLTEYYSALELNTKETGEEAKPTVGWFEKDKILKHPKMNDFGSIYLANPNAAPVFRVGFLHGKTAPSVRVEDDFKSANYMLRIMSDFGIGTMNYRGAVAQKKVAALGRSAKG